MPLNSSGPISIGGSTTGQSINLQLGRAATAQSSLGESALRNLAGVASGQISLSNFYGKPVSCLPYGTLIYTECVNGGVSPYTLRVYYANGTCGTYYEDFNNAQECGAPCPAYGTFLYNVCSGGCSTDYCADGACGEYVCANQCGCPPADQPAGAVCTSGTTYLLTYTNGCCGVYYGNYLYSCLPNICYEGQCCPPAGTPLSDVYCTEAGESVRNDADGQCGTMITSAPWCSCVQNPNGTYTSVC